MFSKLNKSMETIPRAASVHRSIRGVERGFWSLAVGFALLGYIHSESGEFSCEDLCGNLSSKSPSPGGYLPAAFFDPTRGWPRSRQPNASARRRGGGRSTPLCGFT
jgi:hypothetical protein